LTGLFLEKMVSDEETENASSSEEAFLIKDTRFDIY
jgi:hypothetical protein